VRRHGAEAFGPEEFAGEREEQPAEGEIAGGDEADDEQDVER
jgi:hypothetical protein